MKKGVIKISILFLVLMALPLCNTACSDDDGAGRVEEPENPENPQGPDGEQETALPKISFTLTALTHNSLSISYNSTNATECYLLVAEAGEAVDNQTIIEQGESVEVNCEGTFAAEGLTPRTYYCIEFLAINGDRSSRLSMQFMTPAEP